MKVAVLGAGPCGLTAAWELAKNGADVTVIEKDSRVGGLCKTTRKQGYQFDLGGHRFISKDRQLVGNIRELMGDDLLTRERKSVIRFRDRSFDYPINIRNVLGAATLNMNLKFAAGYLGGFHKSGRAPEGSFERWVDDKFGRPLNDYFFKPYTEKLWGIPASRLSDDWAAQRISLLNVKDALLKSLPFTGETPRTYAKMYYYPKGGIGAIFEKMASDIKRLGGTILTDMEPVRLETEGSRVSRVIIGKNGAGHSSVTPDKLLSTIPLDILAKLIRPGISTKVSFRSLRFLNIMLDSKEFSENTWMYVPEPEFIMTRIQEPKRRSPFSAPEGKTSVMLEIPCEYEDAIWSMSDDDLLETVLVNLKALGFDIEGEVKGYFSTRARHAYPRYEMGYLKKVKRLRKTVERFTNLSTLGRQGLFRYIFMDTAMLMGREWAMNIMGKTGSEKIDEICNSKRLIETQSVVA